MLYKNQKYIFYIIFFISILFIHDAFTNTYITIREKFNVRLLKNTGGYCNNLGYGFYKEILKNYSDNSDNIYAYNFNDSPSPHGYFFDFKKKNSLTEIILIGADKKKLEEFLKKKFKIIHYKENCFYLKK